MTDNERLNAREDADGTWSLVEVATGQVLKDGLTQTKMLDQLKTVNKFTDEQFAKWKHLRKTFTPNNLHK